MGQNEKLTALGDLTLTAECGTITVGDLTTPAAMTVDAGEDGTIVLLRRPAGDVRQAVSNGGGVETDAGLDFVAGGALTFNGTIELAGTDEARPQFAVMEITDISRPPLGDARFNVQLLSEFPDLIGSVLDARASGRLVGVTGNVLDSDTALAGAIPRPRFGVDVVGCPVTLQSVAKVNLSQPQRAILAELGIRVHELTPAELRTAWLLYDDFSATRIKDDVTGVAGEGGTAGKAGIAVKAGSVGEAGTFGIAGKAGITAQRLDADKLTQLARACEALGRTSEQGGQGLGPATKLADVWKLVDGLTGITPQEKTCLKQRIKRLLAGQTSIH